MPNFNVDEELLGCIERTGDGSGSENDCWDVLVSAVNYAGLLCAVDNQMRDALIYRMLYLINENDELRNALMQATHDNCEKADSLVDGFLATVADVQRYM